MPKRSAGLLMYRNRDGAVEVFLVHFGGPFWRKKDLGSWSIPKGEHTESEEPLEAAKREFQEETGFVAEGAFIPLGELKQAGGKTVAVWAIEGECDPARLKSNTFSLEWPPRSGRHIEVPEVDRGAWFTIEEARSRILQGQLPFLDRLMQKLG
ncbi:MAG: NUDIX hydrolase [Acidobacteria bacterium]|nr:MAG: NUDIX hydrolase [Acidobacteriota bacterium]